MIITVASFKGGVGKTTTAFHLATYFSLSEEPTLLVDGDPNRSSLGWAERGNLPFEVCDFNASAKASRKAEHIIIDTQGHPEHKQLKILASGCDLLILPTTADALSVDALVSTIKAVRGLGDYAVLLTKLDSRESKTNTTVRAMFEDRQIPTFKQSIRQFAAYKKAALAGVAVCDVSDRNARIAWSEYKSLGKEIEQWLNE